MADATTDKVVRLGVKPARKRSRFRFRYLIVAAFAVWGGYVYFGVQQPLIRAQAQEQQSLSDQIRAANHEVGTLNQQIANLHTYKYIANLAEQKYHLIAPGEVLFTNSAPASP